MVSNPDGSINIGNGTTGSNPSIAIANNLVISSVNAAQAAIQINVPDVTGYAGIFVTGTVTAGTAEPFEAIINASGTVRAAIQNTGDGDAVWATSTEGAGSPYLVLANAGNTNVLAFGMDNADAAKFKIAAAAFIGGSNLLTITETAQIGIGGNTAPTAYLHAAASPGTAGTGPLKLTAGTLLAVPEDGTIEYDGTNFYKTIGATRSIIL
jgi:hypothetical protein